MTTMQQHQGRGRPTGSFKSIELRRQRKNHRFSPDTVNLIEQGRVLLPGKPLTETAFLERAVEHYVAFLAGTPPQESENQEIERLRQQVSDLEREREQALAASSYALAKKKLSRAEPQIAIDPLKPDGTMRSYLLRWEQDGLRAIASLDPIDEYSSAAGYRLDCSCHSIARPGQPLGVRQQKRGDTFLQLVRTKMVQELLKAGWQPGDPAHAESGTTVWRY